MADEVQTETRATGPELPANNTAGISAAELDLRGSNPIDPAEEATKANALLEGNPNPISATEPTATVIMDDEAELDAESEAFEKLLRDTVKNEIVVTTKELGTGRGQANADLQSKLHDWVKLGIDLI